MEKIAIIGKSTIVPEELKTMRLYGNLFGSAVYKIESAKASDDSTEVNAPRVYGVKTVIVNDIKFISAEESNDGSPKLILNNDTSMTFSVASNPFKKIDPALSFKKDFVPEEGWYLDREAVFNVVKSLNESAIQKINHKIEELTATVFTIESAQKAESDAFRAFTEIERQIRA